MISINSIPRLMVARGQWINSRLTRMSNGVTLALTKPTSFQHIQRVSATAPRHASGSWKYVSITSRWSTWPVFNATTKLTNSTIGRQSPEQTVCKNRTTFSGRSTISNAVLVPGNCATRMWWSRMRSLRAVICLKYLPSLPRDPFGMSQWIRLHVSMKQSKYYLKY